MKTDLRRQWPDFKVLGVRVDAVQIPDVMTCMERWIEWGDGCHFIAVTSMHGVMEAHHEPSFRDVLQAADLVIPDGMPLIWLGRRQGLALKRRVYGPEVMETFCRLTGPKYGHFIYGGGTPAITEHLVHVLNNRYGVRVLGTYVPPFRSLTPEEDAEAIARINRARPDVLWVGLGTPKQERWIYERRHKLDVRVAIGVGAAFDFLTGVKRKAPGWMQEHGLEWFFRLGAEPRRLWRRYLIYGSKFAYYVMLERAQLRRFD
jgi:N-acetylglucosaminyldiphosphoundecaprenol N-acetyl-beta-D-mannosaminyltransferase